MEYLTPIDVANRALNHVGAEMMDPVLGFTETSKRAQLTAFSYGKLRRAELRRNVWRFATRRVAMRALDVNTLLLAPALWSASPTYFVGSIVTDASGTLWKSTIPNNFNNPLPSLLSSPQAFTGAWEPYFGPMSVMLYDSSTAYFSGELVYTAAGDGTYNTFLSLFNANAVHPALPNQWLSTTTYFKNQVVQAFPAWAVGTTYAQGQGVLATDGNVYASLINGNIGHSPATSPTQWALVPTLVLTSLTAPNTVPFVSPQSSPVIEWSRINTYALGNVVMFNSTEWLAIASNNTGNVPNAAGSTFWVAITQGALYMSLVDLNIGQPPANAPPLFSLITTYAINNLVGASDGQIYKSLANGNLGHDPTLDGGIHWQPTGTLNPWTVVFTQGGGNDMWMQIGGASFPSGVALTGFNITYPIQAGPQQQSATRNVFRLPAGYLREAPQDPKAGATSFLGAPSGLTYNDWEFEGDFIVSRQVDPMVFRFIADVQDVTHMDDMFCEGLACSIAREVCQPLTQSSAKLVDIERAYKEKMGEARVVNAIEQGSDEPAEDDYITARL